MALAAAGMAALALAGGRADAQTPTPQRPPAGAIVLFDGKGAGEWVQAGTGKPCAWEIKEGALEVKPGAGSLQTKRTFRDCQLHVEFMVPSPTGQARADSGILFQRLYEVQILDSSGVQKPGKTDCAALLGQRAPLQSAAKQPGEWQTFEILFWAARYDGKGKMVRKPRLTLFWNNVMMHSDVEIACPTQGSPGGNPKLAGPITLEEHGSPVRFRNIWVRPVR